MSPESFDAQGVAQMAAIREVLAWLKSHLMS